MPVDGHVLRAQALRPRRCLDKVYTLAQQQGDRIARTDAEGGEARRGPARPEIEAGEGELALPATKNAALHQLTPRTCPRQWGSRNSALFTLLTPESGSASARSS